MLIPDVTSSVTKPPLLGQFGRAWLKRELIFEQLSSFYLENKTTKTVQAAHLFPNFIADMYPCDLPLIMFNSLISVDTTFLQLR